jgi:hypothetical protein
VSPLETLNEILARMKRRYYGQSGSSSGQGFRSSGRALPGFVAEMTEEQLGCRPGQRTGWNYLYTTGWRWIDLPHFLEAANRGASVYTTFAAGVGVELYQATHSVIGFGKWGQETAASSFSYEDLPSNQLGALFRKTLNLDQPLSGQLETFFKGIGAADPRTAPDWNALPLDESAWVNMNTGAKVSPANVAWRAAVAPFNQGDLILASFGTDLVNRGHPRTGAVVFTWGASWSLTRNQWTTLQINPIAPWLVG